MKWLVLLLISIGLFVMTGRFYDDVKTTNFANELSPKNIPTQPSAVKSPPPGPPPPQSLISVTEISSEDVLLPSARFNEDRFRDRLNSTPFKCERCISKTARYFRAQNPRLVVHYFVTELHRIGSKDLAKRTRLVKIADELHSDELLPFWKDLAYRETPLSDSERNIITSGSPTPKSIQINEELTSSVENIGAIGFHDQQAKKILVDIINNPRKIHREALRHRALLSLRESDFNAAIKAVKKLQADDELKIHLKGAQRTD